jgi:predicted nucleic acid-binding protein
VKYLLDTNVISELRRDAECAPEVAEWYRSVTSADLSLSVLVAGEVKQGIEKLRRHGAHRRAEVYARWLDALKEEFADRMLPVTAAVAERWGELRATSPVPPIDGLMAATALEHDLTFVTRDVGPLADKGVRLLNPWATR